ncbi:MAG: hypothetical protein AAB727_01425 [Patescibacteria group bacterium]
MEGPPKMKIESIKNKEEEEKPPRYRTIQREILEKSEDGLVVKEKVLECNGENHRVCLDEISYDPEGNIVFAEQISKRDAGRCGGGHS